MRFLRYILNIVISFVLLILIITSMFINCSKTLISKKNISNFISDAKILNIDVNVLFNQEESGITLKEKIVSLAIINKIPEEIIDDILKSEQINNLLGDFFNQTINYIINGGKKPEIQEKTITDMKKIAKQSSANHLNIMLDDETLELYIENYCDSIINIVPDRGEVIGNIPVNNIEKIINFNVYYLYLIIALILILITLINKCFYSFIKYLGMTMLISGILFVIIGSMEYVILNFIINEITIMKSFIAPLITNVLTIAFKSGVLVSFSSVVLILIYLTIHKISINN